MSRGGGWGGLDSRASAGLLAFIHLWWVVGARRLSTLLSAVTGAASCPLLHVHSPMSTKSSRMLLIIIHFIFYALSVWSQISKCTQSVGHCSRWAVVSSRPESSEMAQGVCSLQ